MSLILDALRKLDRERSFRRSGVRDIAVEMLKSDASRRRRNISFWVFGIIFVAAAGASFVPTLYPGFFGKSQPMVKIARPAKAIPPSRNLESSAKTEPAPVSRSAEDRRVASAPSGLNPSLPPPSPPVSDKTPKTDQKSSPGSIARETAQAPTKEQTPAPPPSRIGADEKPSVAPQPEQKPAPRPIPERPAALMPAPPPPVVPPTPQKPPPAPASREPAASQITLKISGIVWHEDPAERKVVINGTVLSEGGVFEGMKVLEILPDRVRLLRDGNPFELAIFP